MNVVLLIAALAVAGVLFWKATRYFWLKIYYRLKGVPDVDAPTAQTLIEQSGYFLLDVRQPEEYAAGHIADAVLIPLGELAQRAGEIERYKHQKFLIVCRGGVRSARACLILNALGFTGPINLAGGVTAWQKAGLPYVKPAA